MNPFYMGLTTERKIFLGLMVVAGGSLVVDQAILSPSSAGAASLGIDQVDSMPNEPIVASIAKPISRSVTQILNERLSNADLSGDIQDQASEIQRMFAPLVKPAPQPVASPGLRVLPQPAVAVNPARQLPTNLPVLSAVMPSQSGHSGAILNSTLYRIGDTTINGYRLLSVEQRKVLVGFKGQEYWLSLPAISE